MTTSPMTVGALQVGQVHDSAVDFDSDDYYFEAVLPEDVHDVVVVVVVVVAVVL